MTTDLKRGAVNIDKLDIAVADVGVTGIVTGIVSAGWPIGVTGQVTAHGTMTSQVQNVPLTALISGAGYGLGGVTAHGTITAQVQNVPLTALISGAGYGLGGVTAHGTVTAQLNQPVTALMSGNNYHLGTVTAGGEVTARGTITAQVQNAPLTALISGNNYPLGNVTAGGEITAHGTITAEVKGTITAETKGTITAQVQNAPLTALISGNNYALGNVTAGGQITAHGTVTAEAKGTITAEVKGTLTAAINNVVTAQLNQPVTALLSGNNYALGNVTAGGQITAHGTVTAESKGTVTAEVKGTLTAAVSNVVTAQLNQPVTALISGNGFGLGGVTAHGTITAETELPAAAGLADATNNITAPSVGAAALGFNGTTWDRQRVDGSKNLLVSLGTRLDTANDSIQAFHSATAGFLLSAKNAVGTGAGMGPLQRNFGYLIARASGNNISGEFLASLDSANWMQVSGFGMTAGATATAQLTGFYPYLVGQVSWVSASGAASGTMWMQAAGGL